MTPEERQRRMEERMKNMTPTEREAFQARIAQRGRGGREGGAGQDAREGGGRGQGAGQGQARQNGGQRTPPPAAPAAQGTFGGRAQTVDALFAPLQVVTQRIRVWMVTGDAKKPHLKSINVRTGVSDGQFTEIVEGELTEGQEVVTGVILSNARAQVPGTTGGNPLMGPQRGQPQRGGQQPQGGRGR
jgi:hypothetical protein